MAGVKGRSGGARKGAGAKPQPKVYLAHLDGGDDALDFLASVRRDKSAPADLRVRAAMVEAQYTHVRTRDGGKNIAKSEKSQEAAKGKFAPGAPPKLAVVKAEGGSAT